MTVSCPNCKAELSPEFIVEAFMEISIEDENYEADDITRSLEAITDWEGNCLECGTRIPAGGGCCPNGCGDDFVVPNAADAFIHEPQGETITDADYSPVLTEARKPSSWVNYSADGRFVGSGPSERLAHIANVRGGIVRPMYPGEVFTEKDLHLATVDSFEWSPEAMAYVEKPCQKCFGAGTYYDSETKVLDFCPACHVEKVQK